MAKMMTRMIPIMVSPFYYFIVSNASLVALFRRYLDLMDSLTWDQMFAGFIIVIGSESGSRLDEIVRRWRKRGRIMRIVGFLSLRFEKLFGFLLDWYLMEYYA